MGTVETVFQHFEHNFEAYSLWDFKLPVTLM